MKKFVLALGAVAAFAAAANAQTVVTDTDGNGTYSIEELTAGETKPPRNRATLVKAAASSRCPTRSPAY